MPRAVHEAFDVNEQTLYVKEVEDIEPLLDHLREQRNHQDPNAYKKSPGRFRKIGEIPMIIIEKWMRENPPFNPLRPENAKEVLRRVQRDYPYLLAVQKV